MEKELKDYLDRITGELSEIRQTMATKEELAEIKDTMVTKDELFGQVAGLRKEISSVEDRLSKKIDKVDRKLTKKIDETIEYVKVVDEAVSSHRRNTETHVPGSRKA